MSGGPQLTAALLRGVDFNDPEYGFKEEAKPRLKVRPSVQLCSPLYAKLEQQKNEEILKSLVSQCGDTAQFGTMAEAIDQLDIPRVKVPRPYKCYEGPLSLGNPKNEELASISINVERYLKTKAAHQMTASTVVVKSDLGAPSQSTQTLEGDEMQGVEMMGFAAVKQARTYKVNDPDAPGGKRDVEEASLAKGYEYGRTAVHISSAEYNITRLETIKGFEIIGFIPSTNAG
jgi:ATP-dependent DNA helicase 2 subunit 2